MLTRPKLNRYCTLLIINILKQNRCFLCTVFRFFWRKIVNIWAQTFIDIFFGHLLIQSLCYKLSSQLFLLSRFAGYNNYFIVRLMQAYTSIEFILRYGIVLRGVSRACSFLPTNIPTNSTRKWQITIQHFCKKWGGFLLSYEFFDEELP